MLKIQAGIFKGKGLFCPASGITRPTAALARAAIFDVLRGYCRLEEYDFFDVFAGCGAVGFEALSRGARAVRFFENNRQALVAIAGNAKKLELAGRGFEHRVAISAGDAETQLLKALPHQYPTVFFLDPPYHQAEAKVLQILKILQICASIAKKQADNNAIIIIQSEVRACHTILGYSLATAKRYGKTQIAFYTAEGSASTMP